jgi:hypothetical protein
MHMRVHLLGGVLHDQLLVDPLCGCVERASEHGGDHVAGVLLLLKALGDVRGREDAQVSVDCLQKNGSRRGHLLNSVEKRGGGGRKKARDSVHCLQKK